MRGIYESLDDALRPGRDWAITLLDFLERFLVKMLLPDSIRLHRLIVGEGGRFPEIGRIFYVRGPQIVMERLAAYIEGRMDAGDLRADDPVQAAMHLVQIAQTQQNLRLWGIVDIPGRRRNPRPRRPGARPLQPRLRALIVDASSTCL